MPRAIVTPALSETIRSIRLQNKIHAQKLATLIGKSPAFISKLENGNLKTIDSEELYVILKYISKEEPDLILADQIYNSLKLKYSAKEIEKQIWFANFDTVKCLIPIPEALIDYINNTLDTSNIARDYLLKRINANEALSEREINDNTITCNEWYASETDGENVQSIKIKMSLDSLNKILDKKQDRIPYIFLFCIVFYILKIREFSSNVSISEDDNTRLMNSTSEILNSFKFYSISEKNRLINEQATKNNISDILNSFDRENIDIINDIITGFQLASQRDVKTTNEKLFTFSKNLHWDLGFMLKLISLDFNTLGDTNYSNKKKLLEKIEQLIVEYRNLSDDQNRLEQY